MPDAVCRLSLQSFSTKPTDTLVVYVYSNTDPEYQANLKYFLKTGVRADDGCDYVVIIQEVRCKLYIQNSNVSVEDLH